MVKKREDDKVETTIPIGKMARTSVAGITAAREQVPCYGARRLNYFFDLKCSTGAIFRILKAHGLVKKKKKKHQIKNDDDIAEVLFKGLTKLRGSALKVAQIMSLELGVLPEAYRKELYKSHYQVPPLNRALIRRLMISEFKRTPEELFKSFNPDAFAAASLGQVHEAWSHAGERLAVKVQYPGIGSALGNDIQLVKQFMLPFFKTEYLAGAMKELDKRLSEEIDYDLERKNTQWFYDHTKIPGVVIPKTYGQYCSKLVLTTEYLSGTHIDKWMKTNPSQQERDQAAQLIYDFCMHSFFEFHKMHTDPNPGNYLFRDAGKIAVIDFGSVKTFEPQFCDLLSKLWRAHIDGDLDKLISGYCLLGLGKGDSKKAREFYNDHLHSFSDWLETPFREEFFDFGKNSDYCIKGTKIIQSMATLRDMDGFTTETILFDRNLYGLFRIFTELKARVKMKNQWIH